MTGGGVYPGLEDPGKESEKPPLPLYPEVMQLNNDHSDNSSKTWMNGKGILACNQHMLENQLACDFWFTVGPEHEKIGAHRYVLQSRSGVFYDMLAGPGADHTKIALPEVQPAALWKFLRFLYMDELYPDSDTVMGILDLSEKYDMVIARDICLRFLHKCMTMETVCDILEAAHRNDDPSLQNEAMLFIQKLGEAVVKTDGMARLCRECHNKVLTAQGLDISHSLRQEAADLWASKQCQDKEQEPSEDNKLKSLGDVYYVRRDSQKSHRYVLDSCTNSKMSPVEDPSEAPPNYSDLSMDHIEDIADSMSIASMSSTGSRQSLNSQLSRQPSCATWPDFNTVTRFKEVGDTVSNKGTPDAIRFTVDCNISLYGFSIYGNKKKEEVSFVVNTVVMRKKKVILMESIHISGAGVILPVLFNGPIKIEKDKPYTIEIYIHGPESCCGKDGISSIKNGVTVFTFSKATNVKGNRTTDKTGQIPRLYFLPCGK